MIENERKVYCNNWLMDSAFLGKSGYPKSIYYLESLCYHVNSFLKNTPVPFRAELNKEKWSIDFHLGTLPPMPFIIDEDIAPYDYITIVKRKLFRFYPKVNAVVTIAQDYSDDEMAELVKKGNDPNDVILMKKIREIKEKWVIDKIILKDDRFVIDVNDGEEKRLYVSGTIKKPKILKEFLTELRAIKDDAERQKYIEENSSFLGVKDYNTKKKILINYTGKQMFNFFSVQIDDLKKFPLARVDDFTYTWGKFLIKFDSTLLKSDCLRLVMLNGIKIENS